jgi:hypothetical protein
MKTTIEMAREAQLPYDFVTGEPINLKKLEAFAELVRADEAEKYKWDIHSCGPTCKRYACVAMREAVLAEREAIAKEFDRRACYADGTSSGGWYEPDEPAKIIRRGATPPAAQRTWVDLTDDEIDKWTPEIHGVIREVLAQFKEKNNAT